MKTIVIVGAGPGLGLSIARRFGAEGFNIALLARTREKLDALVAELDGLGGSARAYVADVIDRDGLADALRRVEADFGAIDVLEYSPAGDAGLAQPADVTPANVLPLLEQQVLGAVAAVNAVLPGMRERGDGVLLFTTGASSVIPVPMLANVGIAMAGLRNYALTLHQALAPEGIYVAHVAIDLLIKPGAGEADPDALAERFYDLYKRRDRAELKVGNYIEHAALGA
jgi:NAD(P)-dependent dehydrogenase (short-subunit alcohol dehydrogenase family)